ncbi:EamA family transporter [Uliginosibacterium sp. 31-16]|uniref:EamA family transporter n=1 Tax=Uliginosibacterium sp. 31-16 TaxID=3068315 RepID=UPI00273E3EF0|nr:EamA family transporter [Uliginosibacterium sp. 31-16]MDP5238407.1 EamA family transporter [Uliginosibacterium sp. 31-16]
MSHSRAPLLAAGEVALAQVLVNTGAAFAKQLFSSVGAPGMTALRVGLGALILLALWRPWRIRRTWSERMNLALYGLCMGGMNLLIYFAFARIPIGLAVAIEVTGPLVVSLCASRRLPDFAWLACVLAGLAILLPIRQHADALDPLGVAWAFGAAVCWAAYIVFGKRVAHIPSGEAVACGMLTAALFTVPLGIASAGSQLLAPATLASGLLVAVLSSAAPFSLEMRALRHLPHRVFGIVVSASPAIAALAGAVLLGERLTTLQMLAIAMIVAASAGAAMTARR